MKRLALFMAAALFITATARAVMIGNFPGMDKLIESADAIVILRIDKNITEYGSPTLLSTHDCYIYQTLKGDIPANSRVHIQLMDTRNTFEPSYSVNSTHLVFLVKKQSKDEATDYRSLGFRGSNIQVTPFGNEKLPEGKTVKDKINSLLKRTLDYNQKEHENEQAFLKQMIEGSAEIMD